jgi:DNA ligase-4
MFYLLDADQEAYEENVDEYGDSYNRDIESADELRNMFSHMAGKVEGKFDREEFLNQLEGHSSSIFELKNYMFSNMRVYFSEVKGDNEWGLQSLLTKNIIRFGGGIVQDTKRGATHVVVPEGENDLDADGDVNVTGLARTVGIGWVNKCWVEGTRVDEERFQWG